MPQKNKKTNGELNDLNQENNLRNISLQQNITRDLAKTLAEVSDNFRELKLASHEENIDPMNQYLEQWQKTTSKSTEELQAKKEINPNLEVTEIKSAQFIKTTGENLAKMATDFTKENEIKKIGKKLVKMSQKFDIKGETENNFIQEVTKIVKNFFTMPNKLLTTIDLNQDITKELYEESQGAKSKHLIIEESQEQLNNNLLLELSKINWSEINVNSHINVDESEKAESLTF